jgi:exopolysaccharide production protein ExoZ
MVVMSAPDVAEPVIHQSVFQRRARNRNLQWLRGAAALFVLLSHASHQASFLFDFPALTRSFNHGFAVLGVAVFFAISGALMADIIKTTSPYEFLIHRIIRIYPLLIVCSIVLPVVFFGIYGIDLRALSLVPIGDKGNFRLGTVEWTLIFELFFYVVIFFVSILGYVRKLEAIAVGAIVLTVIGVIVRPEIQGAIFVKIYEIPLLSATAAFAGGLLIPRLIEMKAFQPGLAGVAMACAMLASTIDDIGVCRLLGALSAVLVVGIVISHDQHADDANLLCRAATKLGDWSYAIYLCHMSVLTFVFTSISAPPVLAWILAMGAAILVAIPLGMIDIRLYGWLRRRSKGARPQTIRRWAWIYVCVYLIMAFVFIFKS